MPTEAEYQARIAELETDLERLQTGCRLTLHAVPVGNSTGSTNTGTVVGVEEMILQVRSDGSIGYMNGPMARLLQIQDRKQDHVLKQLADRDGLPAHGFHLEVLGASVDAALASNRESVVETVFSGLPHDLLPPSRGNRPATDPILRIVATPVDDQVQVVAQDVTQMRWLESMFSRYVSPQVLSLMHQHDSEDYMIADLREVTVLFADLRGFTAMCETMEPEEVRSTVNSFLTGMVECIEKNQGTVDKFVGDEVMALFGAPVHHQDHALQALCCAIDMQRFHWAWTAQREGAGQAAPGLGIGLATGKVVVGNVGTPERMDYTALGSTVNLAARLCGKAEAGEVLTIKATHEHGLRSAQAQPDADLPHMRFGKKGNMQFKNIDGDVAVIAVSEAR